MSNNYKFDLWNRKSGYSPDLNLPVSWEGLQYYTDCQAFHFSIAHGSHQPYWKGGEPRDSELNIISKYVETTKRNGVFFDIGGHIGTMSIPLSKVYQKVYTFEPCKTNYDLLIKNLEINHIKNVKAYNMAISDCKSSVTMVRHDSHNSGCYQIKNDTTGSTECDLLDNTTWVDTDNGRIGPVMVDFLKIDVQGKELHVLKGAINTIRTYQPFLMIEADEEETDCTCSKDSIVELLQKEGYHMYHDNGADIFMCVEEGETYAR